MTSYILAILVLAALVAGGFLLLRFLFRVGRDLYDLAVFVWVIRKNDAEYKKYLDEKEKNLEKEKEQRMQKYKERQEAAGLEFEEDAQIYSISAEVPGEDQIWQRKVFSERFFLARAIKEILADHTMGLLKGTQGRLPLWQIRVMAQRKAERGAERGSGR